jgi:uncharacterized membrane protein YdjX (TVP38/TMEM64 family)
MKKKLIILGFFIGLVVLIKVFDLDTYFTFENLKSQKDQLAVYVNENYVLTIIIFLSIYILSVAFLIPISTILTLAGGFLFGSIEGTLFVNIGATIGAGCAFMFARYIFGAKLQEKYSTQLEKFNKELSENKYQYLFSLRFLPIFPFFLVNFLAGLTKVDFKTFIITTSLGIIPGSFVYTFAGSKLSSINNLSDIFSKEILYAFLLLGFLTLLPIIIKKVKLYRQSHH